MALRNLARAPSPEAEHRQGSSRKPSDPREILTSIGEVVYDWDIATDSISWGLNAAEVLGSQEAGALSTGRALALATEPESGRTRNQVIFDSEIADQGTGVPYRTRYAIRLGDGQVLSCEDTGRWFADTAGQPAFAHGVVRVERGRAQHDGVGPEPAGVARDRLVFLDQIKPEIVEARRVKRHLSLLVLAIDELGALNEEIGCEAADQVIREVAQRIRTVMRRRDRLVRYAGNRFALALPNCPADQAEIAARRLVQVVEGAPVGAHPRSVLVNVRVGGATVPDHALEGPALLHRAEDALAAARRGGGPAFALYHPALSRNERKRPQGTPATDVLQALNDRRVTFARQPVLEARSRNLAFSEALVRIRDRTGRLVVASDILPAVERSGLVPLVDTRMLELTADYLAANPQERLAINVSPLTLEAPDWLNTFAAHLGSRPGIPSRLIVEITETAAVRDPQATLVRLNAIKALGVAVAIDDFGAGHTSFKHLRSFPVDILKIDGAFVQNLSRSRDDQFFVRTLVDLAHHLDILTVAEWVEDEDTAAMLTEWGIDYLQGDHCGPPALIEAEDRPGLAVSAA